MDGFLELVLRSRLPEVSLGPLLFSFLFFLDRNHSAVVWGLFSSSLIFLLCFPCCFLRILGQDTLVPFSHESGQMLVNKAKMWDALMLSLYMNSFPKFFYPLTVNYMGFGDKEVLPLAILHFGQKYGLIEEGPDFVGHVGNYRPGELSDSFPTTALWVLMAAITYYGSQMLEMTDHFFYFSFRLQVCSATRCSSTAPRAFRSSCTPTSAR